MTASLVGALVLARAVDDKALSTKILQEVCAQLTGGGARTHRKRPTSG